MAQGTFDLWQQTFVLSFMANAEYGVNESSTPDGLVNALTSSIQTRLANPDLQELIGDSWELAWGPCVFQRPGSTYEDNAMYVAHDTVNNIYVVAVAATNIDSLYDIIIEDFDVTPIPWPYGGSAPSGTEIATGTHDGVNVLLRMESQGQTLKQYLQSRADASSSTLIFAGHSLGSALSPTLALALMEQGLNLLDWKVVHVYPTAGPTPGNATFAAYFSQNFPQSATGSQPWQVWNADLANSLDVVPRAWNAQTLATIPTLYAPIIKPTPLFVDVVAAKVKQVQPYGYTRIGTTKDLTGSTVQGSDPTFPNELRYQHIYAYFQLLDVMSLIPIFNVYNPFAKPATTSLTASA
jgi:hypothetical protein